MFRDLDLVLRSAAALLPQRFGYAFTRRVSGAGGAARRREIAKIVERSALELLHDPELARAAGAGFVGSIACDDLDALTAVLWSERRRVRGLVVEGSDAIPPNGPAVFVSFHLGGGFRVFDVLRRAGLRPTFLCAPPRPAWSRYQRTIAAARLRHLERTLEPPFVFTGEGARANLERHLGSGGSVVALLDVAPASVTLHDVVETELFARRLVLPIGLLRLAVASRAAVVAYQGRIENGRRVLRFHRAARVDSPIELLGELVPLFERMIGERPADWQAWLEIDALYARPGEAPAVAAGRTRAG